MVRRRHLWAILFVLAVACDSSSPTAPGGLGGGGASPSGVNLSSSFEEQVVTLMNQRRSNGARCGGTQRSAVTRVSMNRNLRLAAREHSIDMFQRSYFSHVTPEGKTFDQRIRESGYGGRPVGENIATGQRSPQEVMASWMASPGHCNIIMSGQARAVGVGFANNYWTAKFGG